MMYKVFWKTLSSFLIIVMLMFAIFDVVQFGGMTSKDAIITLIMVIVFLVLYHFIDELGD